MGPEGFPKAFHWQSFEGTTDLKWDWIRDYKGDWEMNKELLKW